VFAGNLSLSRKEMKKYMKAQAWGEAMIEADIITIYGPITLDSTP